MGWTLPTSSDSVCPDREHLSLRKACTATRCVCACVQLRLNATKKYAEYAKMRAEMDKANSTDVFLPYDATGPGSRAEFVGLWFGNTFTFALFHQGPYCAALLLQVLHLATCTSRGTMKNPMRC